ncbi:MAG: hypothetical protein BA863_06560 [Desulfovibrio sp. S3730MH75]|nr:MAG: hypothetical protein BA863_06560 [Desulfovibrio sp. S3730MH75]
MHLRKRASSNSSNAGRAPYRPAVRQPAPRAEAGAGFTIMELMVVMIIMGIILAVQLPRLGGQLTGSSLRSAAQMVGTMAYSARFRAADTGLPHVLIFNSRENKVQLFAREQNGPLISKHLPDGISMDNMELEGDPISDLLRVTFHPQGTATGAELLLIGGETDNLLLKVYAADGVVHAQTP